nr:hypothetical protein [Rhodococcus sp. (in: high G+C Gram-positive bacteria)]
MADVDWSADRDLLGRLSSMWEAHDPPPVGLADDIITFVAAAGMEREWELLREVGVGELVGVRDDSDVRTFEFQLDRIGLLVRIAPESMTHSRMDGWLTLHSDGDGDIDSDVDGEGVAVTLVTDDGERTTSTDDNGRFEFSRLGGRNWRLRFASPDGTALVQTPERAR